MKTEEANYNQSMEPPTIVIRKKQPRTEQKHVQAPPKILLSDEPPKKNHPAVAHEVVRLRVQNKWTREQLANRARIKVSELADIETNKAFYRVLPLQKLEKALAVKQGHLTVLAKTGHSS